MSSEQLFNLPCLPIYGGMVVFVITLLWGIITFMFAWLGMLGGDPDWVILGAAGDLVDKYGILGAYGLAIDVLLFALCSWFVTRRILRKTD